MNSDIPLIILAGGFGTRLKSVVSEVPKALAPINDIPFISLQLDNWIKQGQNHFVFSLFHQAQLIIDFVIEYQEKSNHKFKCDFVTEKETMGTGGAVAFTIQTLNLKGDFLLTNADTWLGECIQMMKSKKSPNIGSVYVENCSRYGSILSKDNKVEAFLEKNEKQKPGWINAGVSKLNTVYFENWDQKPFSLEKEILPELVKNNILETTQLNTDFIDIGVPEDYYKFCENIKI